MRKSMRPITLGRIIEVAFLAVQNENITPEMIHEKCDVSIRRAKEIMNGMVEMNLLDFEEGSTSKNDSCIQLVEAVRSGSWSGVHSIMMQYPFYEEFYNIIQSKGPINPESALEQLRSSSLTFNNASIEVLSDWLERIGSIQKNVFTNNYYVVKTLKEPFLPHFLEIYNHLNTKAGITLRKRYVEIPKIRESLCEYLSISRTTFDTTFKKIYEKNIGVMELSGAPITTTAKVTKKRIKHIAFSEIPDRITMDLSSDRVLQGIEIGNKKYYYIAVHEGEIIE